MPREPRRRWYETDERGKRRPFGHESSGGPRRVLSLVALLILVLMLIRQTSDPANVERVGSLIGLIPKSGTSNNDSESERPESQRSSQPENASAPADGTNREPSRGD